MFLQINFLLLQWNRNKKPKNNLSMVTFTMILQLCIVLELCGWAHAMAVLPLVPSLVLAWPSLYLALD